MSNGLVYLSLALLMASATATHADIAVTPIAESGQQVPGMETNTVFTSIGTIQINNSGTVAFEAAIAGPSIRSTGVRNDRGIWIVEDGQWRLVTQCSGLPGIPTNMYLSGSFRFQLTDAGTVGFGGTLSGTSSDKAWWVETNKAEIALMLCPGMPAPGFGDGITVRSVTIPGFCNSRGVSVVNAKVEGSGVDVSNEDCIYFMEPGSPPTPLQRGGAPCPFMSDYTYGTAGAWGLNDDGRIPVTGTLNPVIEGGFRYVAYVHDLGGNAALVARHGAICPGLTNGTFGTFRPMRVNRTGHLLLVAGVTGPWDYATMNGVWIGTCSNDLALAAKVGDIPTNHTDLNVVNVGGDFGSATLNQNGDILFQAGRRAAPNIERQDADDFSASLYTEVDGHLYAVAIPGDPAPDVGDSAIIGVSPLGPGMGAFNRHGQCAWYASLGEWTGSFDYDHGVWYSPSPGAQSIRLVRKGDLVRTRGAAGRTVDVVTFECGKVGTVHSMSAGGCGEDGVGTGFNDRGEVVLAIRFADGSSGAYLYRDVVNTPARWSLDETDGVTAFDSTGNGNHGRLRGDPQWTLDGYESGALVLDGAADYVAVENLAYASSNRLTQCAVAVWVNTDSTNSAALVSFDGREYWSLATTNGRAVWDTSTSAASHRLVSGESINSGEWRHVCVVYDGHTSADKSIYIDGVLDVAADGHPAGASLGTGETRYGFLGVESFAAGFDGSHATAFFQGALDDVRLYHRSLSATEVFALVWGMPPCVEVDSPSNMTFVVAGSPTILSGVASDEDGEVTSVVLTVNDMCLGEASGTTNWAFAWPSVPLGSNVVTASATDDRGLVTTSAAVTVIGDTDLDSDGLPDRIDPSDDGDSLPDDWEMLHFGSLDTASDSTDVDDDGFIDLDEYLANTIPTNSESRLAVVGLRMNSDNQELRWLSAPNRSYCVWWSPDLWPSSFLKLETGVLTTPPTNTLMLTTPNKAKGFFRVGVE